MAYGTFTGLDASSATQTFNCFVDGSGFFAPAHDLKTIAGVVPALNTGVRAAGVQRVTICTDDSVPVTGTFWQATQPVSIAANITIVGTGTFVTQSACTNAGTFAVQAAQSGTWTVGLSAAQTLATVTTVSTVTVVSAVTAITNALPAGSNLLGKVGIDQTTPGTTNGVSAVPSTSGGLTAYSLLNTTAAALTNFIKASVGQIYTLEVFNTSASPVYLRLYNMTTAPASTDGANIIWRGIVPGNANGGGFAIRWIQGLACSTGIAYRATTGSADNDTGALTTSPLTVNAGYR